MALRLSAIIIGLVSWVSVAFGAATLENPSPGALKSGIGLLSGWVCNATRVEISFDGGARTFVPYGSDRADTRGVCGDANNGFGLTMNYNNLGDGPHTATLYVDGRVATQVRFTVRTLGTDFLRGVTGQGTITLSDGKRVNVQWEETTQGFTITGYEGGGTTSVDAQLRKLLGTWRITAIYGDGSTFESLYTFSALTTIDGTRVVMGTVKDQGEYPLVAGLTVQIEPRYTRPEVHPYALSWEDSLTCYVEVFALPSPTTLTGWSWGSPKLVNPECEGVFENPTLRLEGVRIRGPE